MFLPKTDGGLGVKDLELFNLALLGKWRWRFINDENAIRYKLLNARYGLECSRDGLRGTWVERNLNVPRSSSSSCSWKDVYNIEKVNGVEIRWFSDVMKKKVRNGESTLFWEDAWCRCSPFKSCFP